MTEIAALFRIGVDPLELVVRGSAIYWFIFLIFRFVLRRDAGSIGIADVLLLVVVADAAQNGMSGHYDTITEGVILVSTIAGWNWLLDWAAFRWAPVRRFVEPPPLKLIVHGQPQRRALRRELITIEELKSKLREHGIEDFAEVKSAVLESGGEISVLREHPPATGEPQIAERQRPTGA